MSHFFLNTLKFSYIILFISVGCVSTHYDRSENFLFSWKIGDLDSAVIEAEELAKNGPKRDRLLYLLEEASVKRIKGDLEGSINSFSEVSKEYERWFGIHLNSEKRISEEFISTLGSAEWKPYKTRVYERVMMRYFQAINYLQLGHKGRARAEIFKIRQAIDDSKQIWKKEMELVSFEMEKKGVDLENGLNHLNNDNFLKKLNRKSSNSSSYYPKFVNPAALYLESLYFLRDGKNRDDFEKAAHTLKILNSIYPNNEWILDDFNLAKSFGRRAQPTTYVFFETGRAPVRVEKRFDLPIMFFKKTSRIPYLGIATPSLIFQDQYIKDIEVSEPDEGIRIKSKELADFDLIVSQEFDSFYPIELARAITSSILKGGLQHLATDSVRNNDETLRTAVGVGAGMMAQATTRADLRSWSTLPKEIRFCKLPNPRTNKLTIQGLGTNFSKELSLKPNHTNIVIIRSISSYVSFKLVNHITFP